MRSIEERFWAKVNKAGDCWLWAASSDRDGYGVFQIGVGRTTKAHRMAWELAHSEKIPDGLFVCHHCDNPACVRPSHLFLGTVQDNRADCVAKGRHAHGEKHSLRPNCARITADDVRAIRNRASAGEAQKELCAEFGLSIGAVSMIVNRQRWQNVA